MFTPRTIFFIFLISSIIGLIIEGIFYLFVPKLSIIVNKFQKQRLDQEVDAAKTNKKTWEKNED